MKIACVVLVEGRRKEMMLQSFEEEGQALEVVKAQREKEMRLVKERQALKRQMKAGGSPRLESLFDEAQDRLH